ncbi:MAG: PLDc N-terminal domain-containing protein [Bacteroidales bacterium]|nr:PLDc N-terminal domain-containing protein [Bacteroidales bacterium]
MLGTVLYILGIVAAVWCVVDIFKHDKLEPLYKVLIAIAVLAFSWIGFAVYYFLIRDRI